MINKERKYEMDTADLALIISAMALGIAIAKLILQ